MADGIKKVSENVIVPKRALVITSPTVLDNDAIEIGALQSNPAEKGLKIKTAKNTYSLFDAAQFIMPGSITTELLKDGCVTTIKLADKSVTEIKLADDSVSNRTIIDTAVTTSKLANKSVTEPKLADNAVSNRTIVNLAITNSKIANNTIQNIKLEDKTITNSKIADATIINSLLANYCVTNMKVADKAIDFRTLADESVYGRVIKLKGVENKHLADGAVNTNNILNGAVTGVKIPDKQIGENHIKDGAINTIHMTNGAITTIKLGDLSVTTSKLDDKSITKDKLADDVIGLIGDPVQYDSNNDVHLRNNLSVKGDVNVTGTLTASRVYNATYMDIAEAYIPGEDLETGDIVEIREDGKVYKATTFSNSVVGVISNQYAACYGATDVELEKGMKVAVGLIGKVPVKVNGPIKVGQRVIAGEDGIGYTTNNMNSRGIIGKALETVTECGINKVLCLIYPN